MKKSELIKIICLLLAVLSLITMYCGTQNQKVHTSEEGKTTVLNETGVTARATINGLTFRSTPNSISKENIIGFLHMGDLMYDVDFNHPQEGEGLCKESWYKAKAYINKKLVQGYASTRYIVQDNFSLGIDISEHQRNMLTPAKLIDFVNEKEIDFVNVRIGAREYGASGKIFADNMAVSYIKELKKAEVEFGVYFYSTAITKKEAIEEANFIKKFVKVNGIENVPIYIDVEIVFGDGDRTESLKPSKRASIVNIIFKELTTSKKFLFGIYSNLSLMSEILKYLEEPGIIWVANFVKEMPNSRHIALPQAEIWQCSQKGFGLNLDINVRK